MGRVKQKIIVVTGGARGMGATHVKRLIAEGAKVVFTDILEDEGKELEKKHLEQTDYF